ncbi:MAG: hypothetical protein ARM1_0096 [Candidatus Micrarchaeota archaeon]|nr:MAG: hypothetical protein ARM1_0096 [Candidatus Micrarchaeota archaeon]
MADAKRVLVLAVDIDNDLYRKTEINGPVIGRKDSLNAAIRLMLADPLDSDGNVLFQAVKRYDELIKEKIDASIALITGSEDEGYVAETELSRQLDLVVEQLKPDECILVTDGASDERAIPLIRSRLRIAAVEYVKVKQAADLERTYFTILEKLKEPHYARIVFGIPAIIILLFSIAAYLHIGLNIPLAIIGIYLLLYGFGVISSISSYIKSIDLSLERISILPYTIGVILLFIAVFVFFYYYNQDIAEGVLIDIAYALGESLIFIVMSVGAFFLGKAIDYATLKERFKVIKLANRFIYLVGVLMIFEISLAWISASIYFYQFIEYNILTIIAVYIISKAVLLIKRNIIKRLKPIDKNIYNELGMYIGKIEQIDLQNDTLKVKTAYNTIVTYKLDRIIDLTNDKRVIIR